MSAKADAKQLKHATAQLRADHRPRQLQHESRLCRADERDLSHAARRRNGEATRADLLTALASITTELEFVRSRLGQVAPGDHRGTIRMISRGLNTLEQSLRK